MTSQRFYVGPQSLAACGAVTLSPEEARHASAARRLRVGDAVTLFDGAGVEGQGHISASGRGGVCVAVEHLSHRPPDAAVQVTLATALPKGPRQDLLVEKCTELGVHAIWPMRCARSIVKPSGSRLHKLRRTAIEACKQSQRCWVPEIAEPLEFAEVLDRASGFDCSWLAHPEAGRSAPGTAAGSALIAIGPEGGFDDHELQAAAAAGMTTFALGATRLRIETAAIAALAQWLCRSGVADSE